MIVGYLSIMHCGISEMGLLNIVWQEIKFTLVGCFCYWLYETIWHIFIQKALLFAKVLLKGIILWEILICVNRFHLVYDPNFLWPHTRFKNLILGLTHWGRVTHKCVSKLTIIGSDNDLSPGRRQAIIWTNAGILLIGPLGTNFSEILIEIYTFSFKKIHL